MDMPSHQCVYDLDGTNVFTNCTALFVKADDVFYKGGQLSLASRCFREKQILMM